MQKVGLVIGAENSMKQTSTKSNKEKEKYSSFFYHWIFLAPNNLITKLTLRNMPFEDLVLYIAKGYRPLSFAENPWLRHMVLTQHLLVMFPFWH